MNITNLTTELRKEFQKKVDDMLVQELKQMELDEQEKQKLAEDLPGITLPKLTAKEAVRAKELIDKLDGHVSQLAELTVNIGKTAKEYRTTITELNSLLTNRDHNISTRHRPTRIYYIISTLARVLENDILNAVKGFRSMPDKDFIERKLSDYRGI